MSGPVDPIHADQPGQRKEDNFRETYNMAYLHTVCNLHMAFLRYLAKIV
jgi:hypothetical protein